MRKTLTLTELVDEYQAIDSAFKISIMTKEERRKVWDENMLECFPDIEPCPFCKSTVNESVRYSPSVKMISWHRPGSEARISCDMCGLEFTGRSELSGFGDVITQWNRVKR